MIQRKKVKKITVHTDGAARGNPGPSSIAFVICHDDGEAVEFSEKIGVTTNNQAEYRAMKAAVSSLLKKLPKDASIQFFSDSELLVRQLNGEYRVKDANILPHFQEIQLGLAALRKERNAIEVTAVRREFNQRADELANIALDT